MRIYLDSDGVIADFDQYFKDLFGHRPTEYENLFSTKRFWQAIQTAEEFFYNMPLMPNAESFVTRVQSLSNNVCVLTGVPTHKRAINEKVRFYRKHFPELMVICTPSKEKALYCIPGDVLIDDTLKYRHLWEEAGGKFIYFTGNRDAVMEELEEYLQSQRG